MGRPKKGRPRTAWTCAPRTPRRHSFYTEDTVAACSDSKGTEKITFPFTKLSISGITSQGGLQSCSHLGGQGIRKGDALGEHQRLSMPSWHACSRGSEKKWEADTLSQGHKRSKLRSHTHSYQGPSTDPCPQHETHTLSTKSISGFFFFLCKAQTTSLSLSLPEGTQRQ